ncbi:MAG: hypothetical protein R2939_10535 [Kofleriaceae bacterium]
MKKRVVVIGAGPVRLGHQRAVAPDQFRVTVERGSAGAASPSTTSTAKHLASSTPRSTDAEAWRGTTNYWHNALIELDDDDLRKAGIEPRGFAPYYQQAWDSSCRRASSTTSIALATPTPRARRRPRDDRPHGSAAHATNAWRLANAWYPHDDIEVILRHARRASSTAASRSPATTDRGASTPIR